MFEPRGKLLKAMISVACSMGFLLFGYDQGVMGGVIGSDSFVKQFNNPTPLQQGLITGLYDVGCLIGSIIVFAIGERGGRRKAIYSGCIIVIIGTVLQVSAKGTTHLIVGRVVTGVGIGILTSILPTWQSEVTEANNRDVYLTIQSANISIGFVLSNWLTLGASYSTNEFQWIFPICVQLIFAVYILATIPFLVESPRWVANHRSLDEATRIVARLQNREVDHEEVTKVREEIKAALEGEAGTSASWGDIFKHGGQQNLRRMLLGFGALYMQQLSGINSVAYYLPIILYEYLPMTRNMAHILAAVAATQQLALFTFAPIFYIERIGRRTIMMWGAAALSLISVLLTVAFKISGQNGAIMAVVMYCLFIDAFGMSLLHVPWMYASEINSLRMRSKGSAIASASNWFFNGIVVTVTPSSLASIGYKYYIIWAVFNASFIPMIYFFYPEVKGLSLEQIDHIFEGDGYGWSGFTQGVKTSVGGVEAVEREYAARMHQVDAVEVASDKEGPSAVGVEYSQAA